LPASLDSPRATADARGRANTSTNQVTGYFGMRYMSCGLEASFLSGSGYQGFWILLLVSRLTSHTHRLLMDCGLKRCQR
jgi:hypothetical protein